MRWCVIRNPDLPGLASISSEDALPIHKRTGWIRVSEWVTDQTLLRPADHADAPDLDATPAVDAPEPEQKATAKTSSKEKS